MELVIKALGVAIAIAYFSSLYRTFSLWRKLERTGVLVEGIIVDARKGVRGTYFVSYEYQCGKLRIKQTRQVGYKTYSKLKKSLTVNIKHLPNNPYISEICGDNFDRHFLIFLGFFILPLVVAMLRV